MRKAISLTVFAAAALAAFFISCSNALEPETENENVNTGEEAPDVFKKFADNLTVYVDGNNVIIESDGQPNHTSPYWGTGHSLYEAPHEGMQTNPNRISEQNLTFRIPLNPQVASSITATSLGPIGVAVNGVALYNQYAGPNEPLDREIISFDSKNGHPQQFGQYHYHVEPTYLTQDNSELVGFLLDGFPVYGRKDMNETYPTNLDDANGHFGETADYPDGVYHYHVILEAPYISGGYRGTPGTVSQ